jgi:hypothetical protein
MGNVLALDATPEAFDDAKYLSITDDVIANETFVDSILKDLPDFPCSKDSLKLSTDAKRANTAIEFPRKVTRLVQIFSQQQKHQTCNITPEQSRVSMFRIAAIDHSNQLFNLLIVPRIYPLIMRNSIVPHLLSHLKREINSCRESTWHTFVK